MGVSVKPAAFPAGSPFSNPTKKTIGKTAGTVTSFQLEGTSTEVDYIFIKPDVPANFHVLKVIIGDKPPTEITEKTIQGVTAPAAGAIAVMTITNTDQYTGIVAWSPALENGKFKPVTAYTATITLTAKTGYTFDGVTDPFTVAGSTSVTYTAINAGSGTVTAVFPATGKLKIDITDIKGVTAPATGATPVPSIIPTAQYTGTVAWSPTIAPGESFADSTIYTATITITPEDGYTLDGITDTNFFTVAGMTATYNSGLKTVTAVFPETDPLPPPGSGNFNISFTIDDKMKDKVTSTAIIKTDLLAGSTYTIKLAAPNTGSWTGIIWSCSGKTITGGLIGNADGLTGNVLTINNSATYWELLNAAKLEVDVYAEYSGGGRFTLRIEIPIN